MNDMTPAKGHNNPPDPIDEALAPYGDFIEESENWMDGAAVENEAQMKAVDAIIKGIRSAKSDLAKAQKSATAPLYDAYKAEGARWKPTTEDIERRLKCLVAAVDPFKRKLAAEKEAAKRAAYEEAQRKEREAREAAAQAEASDYEAQVEADRLAREASEAKAAASAANKDTTKGLRTVTKHEVTDYAAYWANAITVDEKRAFIDEHARRNHRRLDGIAGLRVWTEKEAY